MANSLLTLLRANNAFELPTFLSQVSVNLNAYKDAVIVDFLGLNVNLLKHIDRTCLLYFLSKDKTLKLGCANKAIRKLTFSLLITDQRSLFGLYRTDKP